MQRMDTTTTSTEISLEEYMMNISKQKIDEGKG